MWTNNYMNHITEYSSNTSMTSKSNWEDVSKFNFYGFILTNFTRAIAFSVNI